ncbi:hypothetical protein DFS34DRAFT_598823 [Phlyctochytrium arcticum]|nr:hypothetical protein DFS34DRAFT_598823 [Phlyctochytrium arcticum]
MMPAPWCISASQWARQPPVNSSRKCGKDSAVRGMRLWTFLTARGKCYQSPWLFSSKVLLFFAEVSMVDDMSNVVTAKFCHQLANPLMAQTEDSLLSQLLDSANIMFHIGVGRCLLVSKFALGFIAGGHNVPCFRQAQSLFVNFSLRMKFFLVYSLFLQS